MNERKYALFGVLAPLTAYIAIGLSISLSPWFSWWRNALSDLGHASKSDVAPIFNFGLVSTGLLIIIYSCTIMRRHAKYTSYCLLISGFLLQLVAVFDEVYGFLHYLVSVLFFMSLGFASITYAIEKRSLLAVATFIVGLSSWMLYWMGIYSAGVAVPETISSVAVTLWVIPSALSILFNKNR